MIRRLLQTIFAISIVALIAGCKPARFVYTVGYTPLGDAEYSDQVSGFDINATTGALTTIAGSPWAADLGPQPSSVTITPSGQFLYATNYDSDDISGYSINASTGALTPVPGSPFPAPTRCLTAGVAVDSSGSFLYVALQGRDAAVEGFTIDSTTGALTPIASSPFSTGGSTPQAVAVNGGFLYVTNWGSANVSAFAINTSTGALTLIPSSPFPAGNQPYSIAVDPLNNGFVYVANSNDGTVSAYSINAGTGALASAPGSPYKVGSFPNSVAVGIEVQVDLNSAVDPIDVRSFLYVVNNASLSAFSVDASTGALTPVTGSLLGGLVGATAVTVDPSGQFAYVASNAFVQNSNANVYGYAINPTTGALTPVAGSPWPISDYALAIITTPGP
jgi:6-phosphogluconolactonase